MIVDGAGHLRSLQAEDVANEAIRNLSQDEIKDPGVIFATVWQNLTRKFGEENLVFPKGACPFMATEPKLRKHISSVSCAQMSFGWLAHLARVRVR